MGYSGPTPEAEKWTQFYMAALLLGKCRIDVGEGKTMSTIVVFLLKKARKKISKTEDIRKKKGKMKMEEISTSKFKTVREIKSINDGVLLGASL